MSLECHENALLEPFVRGTVEYRNYLDYAKSIMNFPGRLEEGNLCRAWENQIFSYIMTKYLPRQANPAGANFAKYVSVTSFVSEKAVE